VAFLFTDLEGSTALLEAHPTAYREAVARHHELLREAVEAAGGVVFETVGDAVYAAFAAPTAAAAAALAGQRALRAEPWGATGPLRVRVGVHLGEVEVQGAHYFGAPLYRCARLTAVAHGGQVVLSEAAVALARDALPAGAGLLDLGEHRLKDLQRPERVAQLLHPALPGEFPPLRSLDALPNNLPVQLTSFVGRERELAEVGRLLAATRLLTLTGTGGTGKTRLALQVAAGELEAFPDGVWVAELAPLADPALVPQAVAAAAGLVGQPGRSALATLGDAWRAGRVLLVLDNCEHVLGACAALADALLRACPRLTVLATSREALGIGGETSWRVPSLTLPAAGWAPAALTQYEAVRLFIERAKAALPSFTVTDRNAPAVAQVCTRLDGIPLALELAAARVRTLTPDQLLARLEDRFRLLTGGSRTALERHQTLQAAVDWSYSLLSALERRLFARLAVFAGGWTLEAAEAVCAGDAGDGLEAGEVLGLLSGLVDKSLVQAETSGEAARYHLLETLRLFARERLREAGEAEAARDRHARWCLDLAEGWTDAGRRSPAAAEERLARTERDNVRAALVWTAERAPEAALRLAVALAPFLSVWLSLGEACDWLDALLPGLPAPTGTRARALFWTGRYHHYLGDYEAASVDLEEAQAVFREVGDAAGVADALQQRGLIATALGDLDQARARYDEALRTAVACRHFRGASNVERNLAILAIRRRDYGQAQRHLEESVALAGQSDSQVALGMAVGHLGTVARLQGRYAEARAQLERALTLCRAAGWYPGNQIWLGALGDLARVEGDAAAARARYAEVLRNARTNRYDFTWQQGVCAFAVLAAQQGALERAVRLVGAVPERVRPRVQMHLPYLWAELEAALATARQVLGDAAFQQACEAGQAMTPEQAVADALEEPAA
jgi:predicted ATPase/class 3 adenylate cyclase